MTDDSRSWVVLELSSRADGEDPDVICHAIQSSLKGAEVFLPSVVTQVGDDRVVHCLVDGYAFVRRGVYPVNAVLRLENTRYVDAVLVDPSHGRKKLAVVQDADIDRMRQQITVESDQGICVGDTVTVISGNYRNIEATVVEDLAELDQVQVFIKLRSKQSIVTLPRSFLRVVDRSPLSATLSRLTALGIWSRSARPIFQWQAPSLGPLQECLQEIRRISDWDARKNRADSVTSFLEGDTSQRFVVLRKRFFELAQMDYWLDKARRLHTFASSYSPRQIQSQTKRLNDIYTRMNQVLWLNSKLEQLRRFRQEVNDLAHKAAAREPRSRQSVTTVQNILVDGHNLAIRCLYAPGISELRDAEGRSTGMILGVLNGLASLKRRYPDARLYVAWDGSSRRRKQMFGDYKANRPAREHVEGSWDPMSFLKKLLPALGVTQLFNPNEEADDVIATMVRGELASQQNLIFTTDRDFLQLVTPTTRVLVPSVGGRKEIMFTEEVVKEDLGVMPSFIKHLRSFYGDTSDNIPGVPRVPKKVLRSLVQAHGTVDGVFKSGLSGLTRGQYERLRSAEPQIRINLTLMQLEKVPVTPTAANPDPDAVVDRLKAVGINPLPIVGSFFGQSEIGV